MCKSEEFNIEHELNKEINKPDAVETKLSSIKSALKQMFIPSSSNDNPLVPADDAFLRATYKEYTTRKKLFHTLVQRIKERIRINMEQNALYAFINIDPETMNYTDEIANALREYGYQVWVLGKNELESLNTENKVNKTTMFMLIMWDKVYE